MTINSLQWSTLHKCLYSRRVQCVLFGRLSYPATYRSATIHAQQSSNPYITILNTERGVCGSDTEDITRGWSGTLHTSLTSVRPSDDRIRRPTIARPWRRPSCIACHDELNMMASSSWPFDLIRVLTDRSPATAASAAASELRPVNVRHRTNDYLRRFCL